MNHLMQWIVVHWIWLSAGFISLAFILVWLVSAYKEANRVCAEKLRIAEWNRRVKLMQERAKNVRYGRDSWAPIFVKDPVDRDIEDSPELVQCQPSWKPEDHGLDGIYEGMLCDEAAVDVVWEANHSEKGDLYDEAQ